MDAAPAAASGVARHKAGKAKSKRQRPAAVRNEMQSEYKTAGFQQVKSDLKQPLRYARRPGPTHVASISRQDQVENC